MNAKAAEESLHNRSQDFMEGFEAALQVAKLITKNEKDPWLILEELYKYDQVVDTILAQEHPELLKKLSGDIPF